MFMRRFGFQYKEKTDKVWKNCNVFEYVRYKKNNLYDTQLGEVTQKLFYPFWFAVLNVAVATYIIQELL